MRGRRPARRCWQQIQAAFGKECLPLNLPAAGGTKVVDCFFNRDGRRATSRRVDAAHRALVEQVVEVDAGVRRALPERRRRRPARAARAARAGAARGPPDPDLLRLGAHRRRRGRAARRDRQAAAEPDRGQPAAVPQGRRRRRRSRMHAEPDAGEARARARVQGHGRPVRRQDGRASASTRARSRATASSTSATAASRSRSATCSCCRARSTSRCARGVPGDICAVAKVDEMHFDAVLHDAAEDDHIHLKPLRLPGAGARPGDRAQAARRRAAPVGDPAEAGRRGPVPEGRARRRRPTRPSSTASASCTCACCSSA